MKAHRIFASFALATLISAACPAHFAFVVPDDGDQTARLMFSETLTPDSDVDVGIAAGAKLKLRTADGTETGLTLTRQKDVFTLPTPGTGTRSVYGTVDLGVMQRGTGKAHNLVYHTKTILGDAFDAKAIGEAVPVELVPVKTGEGAQLELRVAGKPQADAEVAVIVQGKDEQRIKTDQNGRTPVINEKGRVAAWARHWIDEKGEIDGKQFEQRRHYAIIVYDTASAPASTAPAARLSRRPAAPAPKLANVLPFKSMIEPTSSFGAAVSDGWLYVYGGHIAKVHIYSTKAVSGKFSRLDLSRGADAEWEMLPSGPGLQGMKLAAHDGYIYRIGGMSPKNVLGEPSNLFSVADCARYNPATKAWEVIPSLPEPRSSHDVVIIGSRMYVVGGWNLRGAGEPVWATEMLSLDLASPSPKWVAEPAPFKRRALIAAVSDGKLFVLGGFSDADEASRRVDVYDPAVKGWSRAPGLPGPAINGFSPAACVSNRSLFVSVGDGGLHRLDADNYVWEEVARATPRIVHRMVPFGSRLLIMGGAARGDNLALIEQVAMEHPSPVKPAAAPAATPTATPATQPAKPVAQGSSVSSAVSSAALAAALKLQTVCPVMRDESVDADSATVSYKGTQVRLCCQKCVKLWNANPEKYADVAVLPQLRLAK